MSVEADIVTVLTEDVTVSGLVGTKVRPHVAGPNDALPYVVYHTGQRETVNHLTGATTTFHAVVTIESLSRTYPQVRSIADAVREAMNGYSGTDTVAISLALLTSEAEGYDEPQDAREFGTWRVMQDYSVWYN